MHLDDVVIARNQVEAVQVQRGFHDPQGIGAGDAMRTSMVMLTPHTLVS